VIDVSSLIVLLPVSGAQVGRLAAAKKVKRLLEPKGIWQHMVTIFKHKNILQMNLYKLFTALVVIGTIGCTGNSTRKSSDSSRGIKTDSLTSKAKADSDVNKPDEVADLPRTQAEEQELLIKTYDQIKTIDSTFISASDTLHFYLTYYCLKKDSLVVSKHYNTEKSSKDFVTHPFASNILLVHNGDTVLKKQFQASDFTPFFQDNFGGSLKKYGSMSMPYLSRRNKDKKRIVVICGISIPSTDIGIDFLLMIDKNGHYEIVQPPN